MRIVQELGRRGIPIIQNRVQVLVAGQEMIGLCFDLTIENGYELGYHVVNASVF